ncbi:hypothetical protein ACHAXT_013120 [Thalassiosira profunda]
MSSYMASRMASQKANSLLTPLLSDDESSTASGSSEGGSSQSSKVETVKQTPMQKLKSLVVYVGLAGGAAASVGAMALSPAVAIFVMGGLCIANVPYSAIKERQIGKIPSLRSLNNKLREDANHLSDEVDNLAEEIDLLEPEADRAAAVEEELRGIADRQEVNVNKLVQLVKDNEVILAQMRANLRQRIVQDMITIVVKSDKDNDQTIDRSEAKTLALRIRLTLQEYGVEFDDQKFLKVIGEDSSVQGVIAIVQKLLPSEPTAGGEEEELYDSDEEDSDEEEDLYDMFHMCGDNMRGSVSGARGSVDGSGSGLSLMTCDRRKSERRKSEVIMRRQSVAPRRESPRKKPALQHISEESDESDDESFDSDTSY